ncbi:phospho-sugar mutase [Flavobacteriaceae bacterium]|nr:phospho-sugar mutase [Flavobacteriaceae bacterium]MDA9247257.1 phospho-sugar mutase [Flavobacteriaceae bacterium]MDA9283758.1 phospho-sugar mutase [Flavobacteriaceae bacterium]MDA9780751.1 phospho-sugar mutase [Flavobacteriaceae bacterium]
MNTIDPTLLERVNVWLTPTFDTHTQEKIKQLIANDPQGLDDAFYKNLAFGTGGMRGIMGIGDNRINKYTLGKNTQGISNYLKKCFPSEVLKVAIAFDCRQNSKELAKVVADVFSANGIKVFLFSDLRPTPELSFAVKHLDCHCGIVLTASHNPPEYNGYKVYWQDGGQLVPPQDAAIIKEINTLAYSDILFNAKEDLITEIDQEVDDAFAQAAVKNGSYNTPAKAKKDLKIVFTALHGTSITMIPRVLEAAGYTNVHVVAQQATPDGDFPTVISPNPEEPEALKMAIEIAEQTNADIVIGTDPDCDRLGIAVRNNQGTMEIINGNQAMAIKTNFLLENWKNAGKLTGNQFIASTIVSTPMIAKIADAYGVIYKESLTGFKWIAKMVVDFPELEFIGGGEESFGFMVGDFVRDKDAVTASLLACEVAAQQKAKSRTLFEYLDTIYKEVGYYREHLVSLVKKGKEGAQEIEQIMKDLSTNPLKEIAGSPVFSIEDYNTSTRLDVLNNTTVTLDIPKSNVLIYYTQDGSKIAARPSGTEPKIKFYISVQDKQQANISELLKDKINAICTDLNIV